eukprot:1566206-Prymnesium_polylepis.1
MGRAEGRYWLCALHRVAHWLTSGALGTGFTGPPNMIITQWRQQCISLARSTHFVCRPPFVWGWGTYRTIMWTCVVARASF